jgi:hypothetical protein
METLKDTFYNELLGLASPKELAEAAKVSVKEARDFIRKQEVHQVFQKLDKSLFFVPITAKPHTFQVDLMFFGTTLIPVLVCVEITSRLLRTAVLRNKEAATVAQALKRILENTDIQAIETDDGSEFKGAFARLLKEKGIEHLTYPSTEGSNTALAKVERMNGTLRTWLNKLPNAQTQIHSWMPELEEFYNNRIHSSTKQKPARFVGYDQQRQKEELSGLESLKNIAAQYTIGTRVRLARKLSVFGKKSQARWNKQVHTITGREGYNFFIDDGTLPYRAWEMLPVIEPVGEREKIVYEVEKEEPRAKEAPLSEAKGKRSVKTKKPSEVEEAKKIDAAPVKQYVIESITGHKRVSGKLEFLVKYRDLPNEYWVKAYRLDKKGPLIQEYLKKHPRLQI